MNKISYRRSWLHHKMTDIINGFRYKMNTLTDLDKLDVIQNELDVLKDEPDVLQEELDMLKDELDVLEDELVLQDKLDVLKALRATG